MNSDRPLHSWKWFILGALAPTLLMIGPLFTTSDVLAFRDVQHYYSPMLRMIHAQWDAGEIPLWNPFEERGRPLLADPTAAVWYPGQLLFQLPCDFVWLMKLYLAAHVLLAYAAMFYCARRLKIQPAGAAFASCSYAFGGAIVFQCCNPPYLISAAWLPIGFAAVYEIVTKPTHTATILLVLALSMSVLAGDPQMSLLLGLASLVITGMSWWQVRQIRGAWQGSIRGLGRLGLAAAIAAGLTALQWLPTAAWAAESDRIAVLANDVSATSSAGWLPLNHETNRYAFSIGPWRWSELFWPNVAGKPFPQNARWMDLIPAEARYWSPTLYMGLLPIVFAMSAFRVQRGRLLDRWLTWIVVGGALACLGSYGLGWFVNQLWLPWFEHRLPINDETGGLYWSITHLIPGFGLFRYPAKLWTWVALALSLLAGQHLDDRVRQGRKPLSPWFFRGYLLVSLFLLLLIGSVGSTAAQFASNWSGNSLFGPFQTSTAQAIATIGIGQAVLIVVALTSWHAASPVRAGKSLSLIVVLCTTIDVAVANRWLLPTAPAPSATLESDGRVENQRILRRQPRGWYPVSWATTSSPNRLADCLQWESASAKPKYPQLQKWDSLGSATSFSSIDQVALLVHLMNIYDHAEHFSTTLERLSVQSYYGLPSENDLGLTGPFQDAATFPTDVAVWKTQHPFPKLWLSTQFERLDPIQTHQVPKLVNRIKTVLQRPRDDFLDRVFLEATEGQIKQATNVVTPSQRTVSRQSVHQIKRTGTTLHVRVVTSQPAWLVINESFDPGWSAHRRSDKTVVFTPVLRANHVMRSVFVPAGEHEIEFRYRPISLVWGLTVSLITVFCLVLGTVGTVARRYLRNQMR